VPVIEVGDLGIDVLSTFLDPNDIHRLLVEAGAA